MELGLFHDFFFRIFSCEMKNIILMWRGACEVRMPM